MQLKHTTSGSGGTGCCDGSEETRMQPTVLRCECLLGVIIDTVGRAGISIHVRSTPNTDRKSSALEPVAKCHFRIHATQQ